MFRLVRLLGSSAAALVAVAALGVSSCYSAGGGQAPPMKSFYYPIGMAVSEHGNVLYVVNSDFDLQWNGGTVQSYDLHLIRQDVARLIASPLPGCPSNPPRQNPSNPSAVQPGSFTCAPATDSSIYVRDSAIIGAFATDMRLVSQRDAQGNLIDSAPSRLFMPVRGDASITWADVAVDSEAPAPESATDASSYPPFALDCSPRTSDNRCSDTHHAGTNPNEIGNTRGITLPGEPFAMAFTEDNTSLVITHQSDTKASLLRTGLLSATDLTTAQKARTAPNLQFVLDGLPTGGVGLATIPHDPLAFPKCAGCLAAPRPAFLEVSRATPQISLLRYYDDDGTAGSSSLLRPFLVNESNYVITANAGGQDSRGIVIDPSPRIRCEANVPGVDFTAQPPRTQTDVDADTLKCARLPARAFITNRSPASLIVASIGDDGTSQSGTYNADSFRNAENVPLPAGPSRVYLAPIVDVKGNYALRVFILCYDAAQVIVYDPDAKALEGVIRVGLGPFSVVFDPFNFKDVALGKPAPIDPRINIGTHDLLRRYSFAYVASFTNSFVQILDLDATRPESFETIVFRLGTPTAPKGS